MPIVSKIKLVFIAWTFGLLGRIVVYALQLAGFVHIDGIQHLQQLLAEDKRFLVIHRHPSKLETVIIPLLFFPWFLWSPRLVPVSAPDKRTYYSRWWCTLIRPTMIPVPRGDKTGEAGALLNMLRALKRGRPLVLAPEGGRTFKGPEFKRRLPCGRTEIFSASDSSVNLSSPVIRRFQKGVRAFSGNDTYVLPTWVQGEGRRISIVFGEPTTMPQGQNIPEELENRLLDVAP